MNIGDKWGDWTVEALIGEGTFGKVYKIVRNEFGHTYESALKVIRVPQSNAELNSVLNEGMEEGSVTTYFRGMVDEIVEEFTLMSNLRGHSNIVSYEDHQVIPIKDSFGWEICIRMEYLTPLYKYLKEHTLSVKDVIELGIDMCKALEVCQRFNLIHRDIKPENIFVSNMGTYKLGDFGVARQLEKTVSGLSKKGTYTYMAPEVYKGQPYNATVDIYSLGIVLYRFLNNNRTPFLPPYPESITYSDREKANALRMSGEAIIPPVNAQGMLADIVLKACAYDPKERFQHPEEMRRALEAVLYERTSGGSPVYPESDLYQNIEGSMTASRPGPEADDRTVSIFSMSKSTGTAAPAGSVYSGTANQTGSIYSGTANQTGSVYSGTANQPIISEPSLKAEPSLVDEDFDDEATMADPALMALKEKSVKAEHTAKDGLAAASAAAVGTAGAAAAGAAAEDSLVPELAIDDDDLEVTEALMPETAKPEAKSEADKSEDKSEAKKDEAAKPEAKAETDKPEAKAAAEKPKKEKRKKEKKEKPEKPAAAAAAKAAGEKQGISNTKKIIMAVAAVVVIALGIAGYKYFNHLVPDVSGLDAEGAKAMIEYAGLTYEENREFSEEVERGNVISQSAEAGSHMKKGSPVEVVISRGKAIPAPELAGKSLKEAKSAAKEAGLKLEVASEEYSDTLGKDTIISQEIAPGEDCEAGQAINVVNSKGITQVEVPDLNGKGVDEATAALEKLGFKVEVEGTYSSSEENTIVGQSVEAGKTADKGSTITLSKSIGPQPVYKSSGGGSSKKKSSGGGSKKKKKSSGGSSSWGDGNW